MGDPALTLEGRPSPKASASSRRRWLAVLRPQRAAGGQAEPLVTALCVAGLLVLLGVETLLTHRSTIGALSVFPVAVAGWLLGRRALSVVVLAGTGLRAAALALGLVGWPTALSQAAALPLIGVACYLAASSRSGPLVSRDRDRQVRDLAFLLDAAQKLGSSLEPEVILGQAVRITAQGISRGREDGQPRAAYHRLRGETLRVEVAEDAQAAAAVGFEYPMQRDQGALGALRTGRPAIVRPDHMTGALRDHVESLGLEVLAMGPVRPGKEVDGFLVATARDGPGLDRRELSLLEVLAQLTGLALINAEHLQSQREHAERMENLEKVKSHILNLVSHELRGPLTVALGYVSMLEEGALGPLTSESRSVLPIVVAKLNEMEALVEQMLEASRLEEGALVLKRERLEFREVVRDAVATIRPLLDHHHQVTLLEPEERPVVVADRNRLSTILVNLLSNAVKYSPDGGEICCVVSTEPRWARVSVSDRGLGISEADIPKLFTRFGRILTPENRGIPGTGLGLYLSQEVARQHGGEIQAASSPGRGSTFTLTLPRAQ